MPVKSFWDAYTVPLDPFSGEHFRQGELALRL